MLRLFRRRIAAGADRPDRFVGEDRIIDFFVCQTGKTASGLALEYSVGLLGFTFFERFSQADNRVQMGGKSGFDALVDRLVGFAEKLSALAVSDNDVTAVQIAQHRSANFTCPCAEIFPV